MTFKVEMSGLDELRRHFDEAAKALAALDGELTALSINPADPASVEREIQRVWAVIDQRVAPYGSNALVADLVTKMKSKYAERIRSRAAEHNRDDLDR